MKYLLLPKLLFCLRTELVSPFYNYSQRLWIECISERSIIITTVEKKTDKKLALPFKLD